MIFDFYAPLAALTWKVVMSFHLFDRRLESHVRKSLEYLKEAQLARVDHQAAAEHHTALAAMYAKRIARIEAEMNNAVLPCSLVTGPALEEAGSEGEVPKLRKIGLA